MTQKTRQRVLRTDSLSGTMFQQGGTVTVPWSANVVSRQVTVSEGHAWPKDRGVRDAGGDFDTFKIEFNTSSPAQSFSTGHKSTILGDYWYVGNCFHNYTQIPAQFKTVYVDPMDYGAFIPFSGTSAMNVAGTRFISASIPTNSVLDASVSLAELYREGLPTLLGATLLRDKISFFRSLGSEYLSLEFGWKPLVSDIKAAALAIINSDDVLRQLSRDSGRDVHRRRYGPPEITNAVTLGQGLGGFGIDSGMFSTPTTSRRLTTTARKQWFSGCFTYHYDPGSMSGVEAIVTQARLLYGLELTPEVLWNLAPWSWLIDWISNVGPVLHNLSAFQSDGLVMRYGYVMEYNFKSVSENWTMGNIPYGTNLPRIGAETFSGTRKTRRKATPYGFGLDIFGFTNRQWAILAALGITRAPRTL